MLCLEALLNLDVVLPALNETKSGFFAGVVQSLKDFEQNTPGVQVIVTDGGSGDETQKIVKEAGFRLVENAGVSRAARINTGIALSDAPLVLLQHPRAQIEAEGLKFLKSYGEKYKWGCFTHQFSSASHPMLRFTSWYSNCIRVDNKAIAYLDHCPFFNRQYYSQQELVIPDLDIFEDTELSKILSRKGMPARLPYASICSAVRFERNGIWKQLTLNQLMKVCYHTGVSPRLLNEFYEKGLQFNSVYHNRKN